jgi:predicted PurR-regulated permease PerM
MNELVLARALLRTGLILLAVVGAVLLGLELRWVVAQVFAAAIVAAGMAPIVTRLTDRERTRSWRWRPPPALVVVLIYLLIGLVLLVLGSVLLQAALTQGVLLVQRAPEFAVKVQDWYDEVARHWAPLEQLDLVDLLGGTSGLTQWMTGLLGQVVNVAGLLLALFAGALNVIFVLFMALYLTISGRSIRDYLLVFVPAGRRRQAQRIIAHISARLGRWVLGELVLGLIVGTGAFIGLTLIGVPGAPLLALVWAVAELIPGIGPFISAVPTILLGFLAGPEVGVLATIFTWVWSQVENNILVPRVMGHAVKLNPLVVLVALLAGSQLLGLAGALFAVPVAGALAVVVDEVREERLLSERETTPELEIAGATPP